MNLVGLVFGPEKFSGCPHLSKKKKSNGNKAGMTLYSLFSFFLLSTAKKMYSLNHHNVMFLNVPTRTLKLTKPFQTRIEAELEFTPKFANIKSMCNAICNLII